MNTQFLKPQIAESFSRAAVSYDGVAQLQRDIGHQLLNQLPHSSSEVVMDLGCGTGYFAPLLAEKFKPQQLICLDLAQGMLAYAREHRATPNALWLCGDAENLPLADSSIDLIFSSLAIQWCEDLPSLFSEVARVLKPGGRFLFSTLGPDTLYEIRESWSAVDCFQHVNRFISFSQLQASAEGYLQQVSLRQAPEVLLYDQLRELTAELKGIGAHNISAGRPSGLTGKARMIAFKQAYEQFRRSDGQLPATYQVFYGEYING
ncbi:malonyl-ACP O-methyltransferase BioC [Amphritea sp. 2_MG-2023]|jgi:malonyl-CoA O-methyltransferase|uniref:malonyl-ACP O-methyltransferase BioC n=1 Tax=Amphritea TaxID=515417 RepID=UPI001C076973|nr:MULTISPECIES: malonyl-ACP O-methyltransferase BioC [Amphritea]MBU2965068.1 malonyl-ACP O-methyltransferase BioC [Amphritea atlantica]MDO6418853.1 malonyl-ACP O-methyltransferase BioC [Amphritea sp. 2_MG-2023]